VFPKNRQPGILQQVVMDRLLPGVMDMRRLAVTEVERHQAVTELLPVVTERRQAAMELLPVVTERRQAVTERLPVVMERRQAVMAIRNSHLLT
jgi:hypothetical protein